MAERKGFEPSMRFPPYSLSRGAPSAARPPLRQTVSISLLVCWTQGEEFACWRAPNTWPKAGSLARRSIHKRV